MKHDLVPTPTRNDPASAFEALRGEVGLLRRALEGLAAERQAAPDYMPTMADQARRLAGIEIAIKGFAQSPALQLTPASLAADIARAGENVRVGDCDTLTSAFGTLRTSIATIDGVVRNARTAEQQRYFLAGMMLAALYVGIYGGLVLAKLTGPDRACQSQLRLQTSPSQVSAKLGPNSSKKLVRTGEPFLSAKRLKEIRFLAGRSFGSHIRPLLAVEPRFLSDSPRLVDRHPPVSRSGQDADDDRD